MPSILALMGLNSIPVLEKKIKIARNLILGITKMSSRKNEEDSTPESLRLDGFVVKKSSR